MNTARAAKFMEEEQARLKDALRQLEAAAEQLRSQFQANADQRSELTRRLKQLDAIVADDDEPPEPEVVTADAEQAPA